MTSGLQPPIAYSWNVGDTESAALLNGQIRDFNTFALGVPVFRGYQATAQSCTTGSWNELLIDTETLDTYNGHSTTTNTNRYTPQVPGTYVVLGTAAYPGSATTQRSCRATLNGSPVAGAAASGGSGSSWWCGTAIGVVQCNGTTDWVSVQGRQDSGGTISTNVGTDFSPALQVFWLSR